MKIAEPTIRKAVEKSDLTDILEQSIKNGRDRKARDASLEVPSRPQGPEGRKSWGTENRAIK